MAVPEVGFREATVEDAANLALIGAATSLDAFAGLLSGKDIVANCLENHVPAFYQKLLAQPASRAWLAEVAGGQDRSAAPVGYMILSAPDFPQELLHPGDRELRRIYLLSRFHGSGAGQRMMDCAIQAATEGGARRLLLGVHPDNARALAFYHRNGFREIGRRTFRMGSSVFNDPVQARLLTRLD